MVNVMKQGSSAVGWFLDKLLRLAAAATALCLMLAMIVAPMIFNPATTLGVIATLVSMLFGFIVAILLVLASLGFWPDKSIKLKTPAVILLTMIYVTGACGMTLAGAGFVGVTYAKSHGFRVPARANTDLFHRAS
jgi:hypothetical protein